MFKSMFKGKQKKVSGMLKMERETLERKKCKNCLRSVKIDHLKCPHCGSSYFYGD